MPIHAFRRRGLRAQAITTSPVRAALAAALVAVAALLAAPARASVPVLQVDIVANGGQFRCAAQDVAFQLATSMQVSWQCAGSGTRFRCNVTAPGQFALDVNVVALNCNAFTELPLSNPPTLIKASGFESA